MGLSGNKISKLSKNIFGHLESLEDLDLSLNQLTVIHSDSFWIHRKLVVVNFENNTINAIDERFINNTEIGDLNMKGNVCRRDKINTRIQMKRALKDCFENYQPRKSQGEQNL